MDTTLGWPNSTFSVAGSVTNTSKAAPATLPGIERGTQRLLVDQAAARAIDDAHALLHFGDGRGVDDVAGLVGERRVQRDEVGALEQFVEFDLLDADIHGALSATETDR